MLTSTASCIGNNGKNWLLSPETSSQSEGYGSKWLIWLVCGEALIHVHTDQCLTTHEMRTYPVVHTHNYCSKMSTTDSEEHALDLINNAYYYEGSFPVENVSSKSLVIKCPRYEIVTKAI